MTAVNLRGESVWVVSVGESSTFLFQAIEDVHRAYPACDGAEWRFHSNPDTWILWPPENRGPVRVFARRQVIK